MKTIQNKDKAFGQTGPGDRITGTKIAEKTNLLSFKNVVKGLHMVVVVLGLLCLYHILRYGMGPIEYIILPLAFLFFLFWWISTIKFYPAVLFQRAGIEIHFNRARLVAELFLAIGLSFYLAWKNVFPVLFCLFVCLFFLFVNFVLFYFFILDKDISNPNTLSGHFET